MLSRVPRSLPRLVALAGTVSVLAACSLGGGTSSPGAAPAAPAAQQLTPKKAILLAATKAQRVTSFEADVAVTINQPGSGPVDMAGTITEQLSPSLRAKVHFSTFHAPGVSLRGGVSEILTPQAVDVKMASLSQAFHTTKPWVAIPVSEISNASGINFSSLFNQQTSNPLSQTQMLTASPDVHKVGTTTVNGVPVTEYAGTYSMAKALATLPAASRAGMSKQITSMGLKTARFQVWIDGQQQVRKISATLTSSKLTETVSETITSVNQPVDITPPPAAETYVLPAGMLS